MDYKKNILIVDKHITIDDLYEIPEVLGTESCVVGGKEKLVLKLKSTSKKLCERPKATLNTLGLKYNGPVLMFISKARSLVAQGRGKNNELIWVSRSEHYLILTTKCLTSIA